MGRRGGVVLSAFGLIFGLIGLWLLNSATSAVLNPSFGSNILAGLAIGLTIFFASIAWIISLIFYVGAYLITRGLNSKATGTLMVLGGLIGIGSIVLIGQMLARANINLAEAGGWLLILLVLLPVITGLLLLLGGMRRIRTGYML